MKWGGKRSGEDQIESDTVMWLLEQSCPTYGTEQVGNLSVSVTVPAYKRVLEKQVWKWP